MSDYIEYESDNEDYMEDEYITKKRHEIADFTLNDYMSCNTTRDLLMTNWQEKFDDNLEKNIEDIFEGHYEYLKGAMSNVLYRADKHHIHDLLSLVQHHLVRDYDTSIFYENPDLADPLISDFNRIEQERKDALKKRHSKAFSKTNKEFDWNTMPKKLPKTQPNNVSIVEPIQEQSSRESPQQSPQSSDNVYNLFKNTTGEKFKNTFRKQSSYTPPGSKNKFFDWSNKK
jgi:hypothetical protein